MSSLISNAERNISLDLNEIASGIKVSTCSPGRDAQRQSIELGRPTKYAPLHRKKRVSSAVPRSFYRRSCRISGILRSDGSIFILVCDRSRHSRSLAGPDACRLLVSEVPSQLLLSDVHNWGEKGIREVGRMRKELGTIMGNCGIERCYRESGFVECLTTNRPVLL